MSFVCPALCELWCFLHQLGMMILFKQKQTSHFKLAEDNLAKPLYLFTSHSLETPEGKADTEELPGSDWSVSTLVGDRALQKKAATVWSACQP